MAPKHASFAPSPSPRPSKRQKKAHDEKPVPKPGPSKPSQKSNPKPKPKVTVSINEDDTSSSTTTNFMVVAGSYEKLLYGLEGSVSETDDWSLKPVFIFPAHVSCIKAVAASSGGKWLATGSTDEIIKVWDLRRRKEVGGLMHHEGSITHLVFPSKSHLMSCSEDGTLALFRTRDWVVLRTLKGHKGRVNSVGVHPSGKLALSVGKDRTLRMWDLMRGKGCASMKLGKEAELVRWSSEGSMFAVQYGSNIDLYATDMKELGTISHPSRVVDVLFCRLKDEDILLVGAEDKKLSAYSLADSSSPKMLAVFIGHTNRIKAIQIYSTSTTTVVCTASSDGKINLYNLASVHPSTDTDKVIEIEPKASYDTKGTRLTCLTVGDVKDKENSTDAVVAESDGEEEEWSEQEEVEDSEHESSGGGDLEEEEGEEELEVEEEDED
ncbi:WD40-repeat-containing domain protein [Flagelloscypha sp. PMI_526]|nr:WD40-repeat-containing domain protein [Flagelloscypha sp. PMI_526]